MAAIQGLSELRRFTAPEFLFGVGARECVATYAGHLAMRKVLLVTDRGVLDAGWAEGVRKGLQEVGIGCVVFSDVTENPKAEEVMQGARVYSEERCNGIVAVGGGSPMDCAKGIGIVCTNPGHVLDYVGVDEVVNPMPPLICVPTTGGSSADVSQFAIITDLKSQSKKAIVSRAIIPDLALIDPMTLTTLAEEVTANVGIDAIGHAMEAYVSNANSPLTDLLALDAFKLLVRYLPESLKKPKDIGFREKVMQGSMQAGLAFSNASLGAIHAMAHSLGGLLDRPHGQCNAILLPHVVEFNYDFASARYRELAKVADPAFGVLIDSELKQAFIEYLIRFTRELGIQSGLCAIGVKHEEIAALARVAYEDPCLATNPRAPKLKELEEIYERAF